MGGKEAHMLGGKCNEPLSRGNVLGRRGEAGGGVRVKEGFFFIKRWNETSREKEKRCAAEVNDGAHLRLRHRCP